VQAALNALSSIGGVGGSATVSLSGGVYTITFGGALGNMNLPVMTATGAGGATATVTTFVDGSVGSSGAPAYFVGLTSTDAFTDVRLAFTGSTNSYLIDDIIYGAGQVSSTPEPGTLILFGAGLALLWDNARGPRQC